MRGNFWLKLKKPIITLAPMAGITDAAFRYLCQKYGADVIYSEMVNVTAICHESKKTLAMLKSYKRKAPFVAQFFGNDIGNFRKSIQIVEKEIKPDGIDINFGCPAPKITKNRCGVELFKNLYLSREIIAEAINSTNLPVSIKVRVRAGDVGVLEFMDFMKDLDIKAVMVHGRSSSEGFKGEVDFETIKKVKEIFPGIVLANGGVNNFEKAEQMLERTKADGIGLAQGTLGRPWLFKEIKEKRKIHFTKRELFKIILKHAKIVKKIKGEKGIVIMRKHLLWYSRNLRDAKKIRKEFTKVETIKDIKQIIKDNT